MCESSRMSGGLLHLHQSAGHLWKTQQQQQLYHVPSGHARTHPKGCSQLRGHYGACDTEARLADHRIRQRAARGGGAGSAEFEDTYALKWEANVHPGALAKMEDGIIAAGLTVDEVELHLSAESQLQEFRDGVGVIGILMQICQNAIQLILSDIPGVQLAADTRCAWMRAGVCLHGVKMSVASLELGTKRTEICRRW